MLAIEDVEEDFETDDVVGWHKSARDRRELVLISSSNPSQILGRELHVIVEDPLAPTPITSAQTSDNHVEGYSGIDCCHFYQTHCCLATSNFSSIIS